MSLQHHRLTTIFYIFVAVIVLVALLDSVSSRPSPDDQEGLNAVRIAKPRRANRHHRHNSQRGHSSRGLKQASDYGPEWSGNNDKVDPIPPTVRRMKKKSANKKRKTRIPQRPARRAVELMDTDDAVVDDLLGLGVFGDMRKFFDDLKTNLEVDPVATIEMDAPVPSPPPPAIPDDVEDLLPTYLALRTTPSSEESPSDATEERRFKSPRLRGFVSMGPESSTHHRAHHYDPALLWTGLGRR